MPQMDLFVSYSRADSGFVLRLCECLRRLGVQPWVDQLDIRPGAHWDHEIESALRTCNAMLVVLSKASVASSNVMDEVSYALENKKTVLPILVEPCERPYRISRLQYVEFRGDLDSAAAAVARRLRTSETPVAGDQEHSTNQQFQQPIEEPPAVPWKLYGAGSAGVVLLAFATLAWRQAPLEGASGSSAQTGSPPTPVASIASSPLKAPSPESAPAPAPAAPVPSPPASPRMAEAKVPPAPAPAPRATPTPPPVRTAAPVSSEQSATLTIPTTVAKPPPPPQPAVLLVPKLRLGMGKTEIEAAAGTSLTWKSTSKGEEASYSGKFGDFSFEVALLLTSSRLSGFKAFVSEYSSRVSSRVTSSGHTDESNGGLSFDALQSRCRRLQGLQTKLQEIYPNQGSQSPSRTRDDSDFVRSAWKEATSVDRAITTITERRYSGSSEFLPVTFQYEWSEIEWSAERKTGSYVAVRKDFNQLQCSVTIAST